MGRMAGRFSEWQRAAGHLLSRAKWDAAADSTEIAGVIMPSPKDSDAPKMPNPARTPATRRRTRSPRKGSVRYPAVRA